MKFYAKMPDMFVKAKKKRILHVIRQFYPSTGGMERFVKELAQFQAAAGYSVSVLTLNRLFGTGQLLIEEELLFAETGRGIRVLRLPFVGGARFFLLRSPVNFDFNDFDCVHLHGVDQFLGFFVAKKAKGLLAPKLLLSTHGGFFHTHSLYLFKKLWFHTITRLQLRYIDIVCACSIHDLLLFRSIASRHIELIENGVDVSRLLTPEKQPDLSRLLYVGGFRSNKQVLRLLYWFNQARKEWPDMFLTLVGEGEQKQACLDFVQVNGLSERVRFIGFLSDEDLGREYINAGLFVSASVYEGFGLSAVEAMAAGCLLLLNRIDSFAIFVPEELNGFTVDFEITEKVSLAYGSLRRLSSAAQKEKSDNSVRIAARFDWSSVQKSFDKVYDLLLDGK